MNARLWARHNRVILNALIMGRHVQVWAFGWRVVRTTHPDNLGVRFRVDQVFWWMAHK